MGAVMSSCAAPFSRSGWIGSWSPGVGDPTIAGWVTVAAYIAAAALCLRAARSRAVRGSSEARLWYALALGLLVLGVNKQLDLQSALTEFGRWFAKRQGFYGRHRELQRWFIGGVLVVATCASVVLVWSMRRAHHATKIAGVGVCALLGFIASRAASFHHFDHLPGVRVLGMTLNWALELGGIGAVVVGALRRHQTPGSTRRT
jgi:hypothetical protein